MEEKLSPCAHRRLQHFFFFSSQQYLGHRAGQIKRGWDLIFKSLSHYFTVTQKEYQCTYVTVISFLASNFWLISPHGGLWMRHERLFSSISTLPWGSVWSVSIQTLTKRDRHTLSALLLTGSCILHGVTAPKSSSEARGRKAHKLQRVFALVSFSCERPADHQPYYLRVPVE